MNRAWIGLLAAALVPAAGAGCRLTPASATQPARAAATQATVDDEAWLADRAREALARQPERWGPEAPTERLETDRSRPLPGPSPDSPLGARDELPATAEPLAGPPAPSGRPAASGQSPASGPLSPESDDLTRAGRPAGRPPAATRPTLYVTDIDSSVQASFIAHVNHEVILTSDIVGPLQEELKAARRERSPEEFVQYRDALIRARLEEEIQRRLVLQEADRELNDQQKAMLQQKLDEDWKKTQEKLMKAKGVRTVSELVQVLAQSGRKYEEIKEDHRRTFYWQQYLRYKLMPKTHVTREEMLAYYDKHRDQFVHPPAVLWSGLLISDSRAGSRAAARRLAEDIRSRLAAGEPLEAFAAEHPLPGADRNGQIGWNDPKDINPLLAEAMKGLKPGEPSRPVDLPDGVAIVMIQDRRDAQTETFEQAQEKIRQQLTNRRLQAAVEEFVEALRRKAYVRTVFDE